MKQLSLTESQIETILRALSNENSVDQDLERRRILEPKDIQKRSADRMELRRLLRSLPEVSLDFEHVMRLIEQSIDDFQLSLAKLSEVESLGEFQDKELTRQFDLVRMSLYSTALKYQMVINDSKKGVSK